MHVSLVHWMLNMIKFCIRKSFLFEWNSRLSDGGLGFLSLPNTLSKTVEARHRWEERDFAGGMSGEWMMTGGWVDVWRPPCLPTMSSSPLFLHLSPSLPPSGFIQICAPLIFFFFLFCYFSPLPLFLSVCFSLLSATLLSPLFCVYSCLFIALHLLHQLLFAIHETLM